MCIRDRSKPHPADAGASAQRFLGCGRFFQKSPAVFPRPSPPFFLLQKNGAHFCAPPRFILFQIPLQRRGISDAAIVSAGFGRPVGGKGKRLLHAARAAVFRQKAGDKGIARAHRIHDLHLADGLFKYLPPPIIFWLINCLIIFFIISSTNYKRY